MKAKERILTQWPVKYHTTLDEMYRFFMSVHGTVIHGAQLYLAYSGGVDSLVLYHYLTSQGLNVIPVYVLDTQDESEYQALYKPDNLITCDTRPYIPLTTPDYENKFRKSRYEQISEVVGPNGVLLTAHHFDDVIETYVMRTMQGTGIMSMVNPMPCVQLFDMLVLRPLLFTPKDVIQQYASEYNLPVLYDTSNDDVTVSLRNHVRANIVPHIKSRTQYGKIYRTLYGVKEDIVRTSRLMKSLLKSHSTVREVPVIFWENTSYTIEEVIDYATSGKPLTKTFYDTTYDIMSITQVVPFDEFLLLHIPGIDPASYPGYIQEASYYKEHGLTVRHSQTI
jgi:tRNA(Ile)-lysidine synthetase-like protein